MALNSELLARYAPLFDAEYRRIGFTDDDFRSLGSGGPMPAEADIEAELAALRKVPTGIGAQAYRVHFPRMNGARRQRWLGTAILAGVLYGAVGVILAALAGAAGSHQMLLFWRLSAWVISAVVFAIHIAHEHFRLHNAARPTAWHVSVGVALGGFALALAANIHELWSASGYRPRMLLSLVAWPILTGVPAFIVALVVAGGLGVLLRPTPGKP